MWVVYAVKYHHDPALQIGHYPDYIPQLHARKGLSLKADPLMVLGPCHPTDLCCLDHPYKEPAFGSPVKDRLKAFLMLWKDEQTTEILFSSLK